MNNNSAVWNNISPMFLRFILPNAIWNIKVDTVVLFNILCMYVKSLVYIMCGHKNRHVLSFSHGDLDILK